MAEPLRKSVQTVQPVRQQPVQEPRKTEAIARRVAVRSVPLLMTDPAATAEMARAALELAGVSL